MANVDDRVTFLRQRFLLRRAREPIDSLELYRLQHEERIEGASEIVPSSSSGDDSASGDDGGDDSVIEVFPTPKKVLEIDLTSSPMPTAQKPNESRATRASPVATGCKICLESIRDIR